MTPNKTIREFRRYLRDKGIDDSQYTNSEIVKVMDSEKEADGEGKEAGLETFDADRQPDITPDDLAIAESLFDKPAPALRANGTKSLPTKSDHRLTREEAFQYGKAQVQETSCGTCKFYDPQAKCSLYEKLDKSDPDRWDLDSDVSAWMWCTAHMLGLGFKNLNLNLSISPMSALNQSLGGALIAQPKYGGTTDDDLDKLEQKAKIEAQKSHLPHVRGGMYKCSACSKRYFTEAKAEKCCDAGVTALRGKSATPGGSYEPGPGRFRKLAQEEEGQTTSPPTQEYLDIDDLDFAMDRENSSATGGPISDTPEVPDAEPQKKYASTQFDLPDDLSQKILAFGKKIPPEELAEKGLEENGHIRIT